MGFLAYYIREIVLRGIKTFFGYPLMMRSVNEEQIAVRMAEVNRNFTKDQYLEVMRTMISVFIEYLSAAFVIRFFNLFRMTLSIKGSFESGSDSFLKGRNSIAVKIAATRELTRTVNDKVQVEKVEPPGNEPKVKDIEDGRLKLDNPNSIHGVNFALKGYRFSGLEITNREDKSLVESIGLEHLGVTGASDKHIVIGFKRGYKPVNWLVDGVEVYLKLEFTHEESELVRDSDYFETVWSV